MGLIIGKSGIPMFKVGYPTVSDKYNITGGTLAGTTPVKFGDLVKFSAAKGYFEAITGTVTVGDIAGFVLATIAPMVVFPDEDTPFGPARLPSKSFIVLNSV